METRFGGGDRDSRINGIVGSPLTEMTMRDVEEMLLANASEDELIEGIQPDSESGVEAVLQAEISF